MTVAVFAGELPTTVFIQRLVDGLAKSGTRVLLMGKVKGKLKINSSRIRIIGARQGLFHLFLFLKYFTLLQFQKPGQKKKLDVLLQQRGLYSWKKRAFYYPVLYYHPDVLHLQWAKSVADWIWVEDFGIRLVVSLRGAHINYSPLHSPELAHTYRTLFSQVSRFHAVSQAISMEAQQYGAPVDRIDVVYSGMPIEQLMFRKKEPLSKPIQILSVGRNHWKKGYTVALDAMAILKQQGITFHYTLVGVIPNEELLYQFHELGLESHVTFIPAKRFDEVVEMISSADVLLLPSIEEGIANVVLEAMALGTLVVTTDCGGMVEAVTHHQSGFVVPVLDPESMAESLVYVSQMPIELYQTFTESARKSIEQTFTVTHMVQGMQDIYQKAILL
ncbi:MAG: glycosyltransferase family 4 protein [Flavobacterium sp.]